MIKSGYRIGTGLNESFLQMRVIETGDSKLGPYKAIKSSDQNKLYDLKNELHQQLGTGNINTDIKKDVLYLYLTKSVDETKLAKLFSKYKINESVDMNESATNYKEGEQISFTTARGETQYFQVTYKDSPIPIFKDAISQLGFYLEDIFDSMGKKRKYDGSPYLKGISVENDLRLHNIQKKGSQLIFDVSYYFTNPERSVRNGKGANGYDLIYTGAVSFESGKASKDDCKKVIEGINSLIMKKTAAEGRAIYLRTK